MYCSHCGRELMGESEICVDCANALYNQANFPKKRNTPKWLLVLFICSLSLIVIFSSLLVVFSFLPDEKERENDVVSSAKQKITLENEIYGHWHTVTGHEYNTVSIAKKGEITLSDDENEYTAKYRIISSKRFFVSFSKDMNYEFEYSKNVLVRYKNSIADGYTYEKSIAAEEFEEENIDKESKDESDISLFPNAIEYDLKKIRASIAVWERYENNGAGCKLSENEVPREVYELLTDEQKWVYGICMLECCDSVDKVKSHLTHYFSETLLNRFVSENFIEYGGNVYVLLSAKGGINYDKNITELDVERLEYNTISVTTKLYNSGGDFSNNVRFIYQYVGGSYIVVDIIE